MCGGGGRWVRAEHGRASERENMDGGGEVPINLRREGGCKKKGKRCKERAQGSLCFGCRGIHVGPGREGVRGSGEQRGSRYF